MGVINRHVEELRRLASEIGGRHYTTKEAEEKINLLADELVEEINKAAQDALQAYKNAQYTLGVDDEYMEMLQRKEIKAGEGIRGAKEPERESSAWVPIDEEPHEDYECAKCGEIVTTGSANIKPEEIYRFCPKCGSRMTGAKDEVE